MQTCPNQTMKRGVVMLIALTVVSVWEMNAGHAAYAQAGCASQMGGRAGAGGRGAGLAGGAVGRGGVTQFQQQAMAQFQRQVFLRQQSQIAQQRQQAVQQTRQLQQAREDARRKAALQATAGTSQASPLKRRLTPAERAAERRAAYLRARRGDDAGMVPENIAQDTGVPATTPVATTGPSA